MAFLSKTAPASPFQLVTTNASAGDHTILALSTTETRWIRGFTIVANGTSGTWNFACATAAIQTAANSLWFGQAIAAGATFTYVFPGKGLRMLTTDTLMGFASVANMACAVNYDVLDLT